MPRSSQEIKENLVRLEHELTNLQDSDFVDSMIQCAHNAIKEAKARIRKDIALIREQRELITSQDKLARMTISCRRKVQKDKTPRRKHCKKAKAYYPKRLYNMARENTQAQVIEKDNTWYVTPPK